MENLTSLFTNQKQSLLFSHEIIDIRLILNFFVEFFEVPSGYFQTLFAINLFYRRVLEGMGGFMRVSRVREGLRGSWRVQEGG